MKRERKYVNMDNKVRVAGVGMANGLIGWKRR